MITTIRRDAVNADPDLSVMNIACLCVLLGAYAFQLTPQVPPDGFLAPGALCAVLLLACRQTRIPGAFACGVMMMWYAADRQLEDRLQPSLAGQVINVTGRIVDFPVQSGKSWRFAFAPAGRVDLPEKIRLSWFESSYSPSLGDTWHLQVRLQRPRGLANPAGFDMAGWLFQQGIGATGYVLEPGENRRLLSLQTDFKSRSRQRFVDRVSRLLPQDHAAAVLLAIGVGARHRITREAWDEYAATGTSHLMAISGLHIGLAASSFFVLGWVLLAPVCRRINARNLATMIAIIAASAYAQLSGFAIPAQRALLMAIMLAAAVAMRRRHGIARVLTVTCVIILCADPLAILSAGFRMSFAAVAIIFLCLQVFLQAEFAGLSGLPAKLWIFMRRLLQIQIALMLGLFPLSVLIFDRFAISAPVVNMIALPLFNFVTVPGCLFGMLLDGPFEAIGDILLTWSYDSIALLIDMIGRIAAQPQLRVDIAALPGPMLVVTLLPILFVLLPTGWPARRIALIAVVAITLYRPPSPRPGCFDFTALDVGQGLAIVVHTNAHTLLFDTGPVFHGGSDVAQFVVVPFLRRQAIYSIDKLIVSHADLDHAGGLRTVLDSIHVGELLAGERLLHSQLATRPCRAGQNWHWDGIHFQTLHPQNRAAWAGNNLSCVVLISAGGRKLLLTGDIESPVEILLAYRDLLPQVDSVVVPHHGSKTSSSHDFVTALQPDVAIVASGFNNRWGMPKEEVVNRWRNAGAMVASTAASGAISQRLCSGLAASPLVAERATSRRYWLEPSPDAF